MTLEAIETRVGFADFGDYEAFGKRLYRDMAGRTSFLGLAVFAVAGRELPARDIAWLDDLALCMYCPEPRVWPAKLSRIAASKGRIAPGVVAGWSALDSDIGVQRGGDAALMLVDLRAHVESAATSADDAVASFVRSRATLPGFGVYGRKVDERVEAVRTSVTRRERTSGTYWQLAERLWRVAQAERSFDPSIWTAGAAVILDVGLEPVHVPPLLGLFFQLSFMAHTFEGAALKSPSLIRLPPEAVRYVGRAPRESPRFSQDRALRTT